MIAENGEASGGAAAWFDLLIETKADPKQSHRETTNLFWCAYLENNPFRRRVSLLPDGRSFFGLISALFNA